MKRASIVISVLLRSWRTKRLRWNSSEWKKLHDWLVSDIYLMNETLRLEWAYLCFRYEGKKNKIISTRFSFSPFWRSAQIDHKLKCSRASSPGWCRENWGTHAARSLWRCRWQSTGAPRGPSSSVQCPLELLGLSNPRHRRCWPERDSQTRKKKIDDDEIKKYSMVTLLLGLFKIQKLRSSKHLVSGFT